MLDYNQIQKLFGAPLNNVPQSNLPFKLTRGKIILLGVFLILNGLGVFYIYQKLLSVVRKLIPKKEEPTLILPPKPAKDIPKATVTIPIPENDDSIEDETPETPSDHDAFPRSGESIQSNFRGGEYTEPDE